MHKQQTTLNNLRVLVTRPAPAGEALCEEITAAGGDAIFFPTINFAPAQDAAIFQRRITELDQYDWLIFISPQAVYASHELLHTRWPVWPEQVKVAAIGAGTAEALRTYHLPVSIHPEEWNSEGLLALPAFQTLTGKRIALVCGADGRDTLAEVLSARGAVVVPFIAYQRCLPDVKVQEIENVFKNQKVEVAICASGTGLQNLKKLLQAVWPQLRKVPMVVVSERLEDLAKNLGFKRVFLAKNASHSAIIATLSKEFVNNHPKKGRVMENQVTTKSMWKGLEIITTLFIIVVLIAVVLLSYSQFVRSHEKLLAVQEDLNNKIMQTQAVVTSLQKTVQDNQQTGQQLQTAVTNQQQLLNQLHATQQTTDLWRISEAQYLVNLANDNLQVGGNAAFIVTLLQNADQKIRDMTDPKLLTVRKALSTDIAALQAIPSVDITGIYLQLAALNEQVDKLPLPAVSQPEINPAQNTDTAVKQVWWRRGLQQTWASLSKIIIVRHNPTGERPFISPDQQTFLYQNLHAMFEQALSAVMNRDTTVYRTSLTQANNWIKQYFLTDAPVTQAMLNNLNQLQTQTLRPTLPTINASLQAFHDYFAVPDQTTAAAS